MIDVVVPEDLPLSSCRADTADYRRVILLIGEEHWIRKNRTEHAENRVIRGIASNESQARLLPMQIGDFAFELDQGVVVSRDISGTTGCNARTRNGLVHCRHHCWVLSHAQVVVAAPHRD